MSTLLIIEKLNKTYNTQTIFKDASLVVAERQKIGVIGRNGAGKSTLFKIIVGQEDYDSGRVSLQDIARLGYLEQYESFEAHETVLEFLQRLTGQEPWQCAKVAGKFELGHEMLSSKASILSGGYRMRLRLTVMLLKEPNFFLLDEPTNFLDVHTQLLLERFLESYNGAFLIISHDREFLKRTCKETLDVERGGLFLHPTGIDNYLAYKEERLAFARSYNKRIDRQEKHLQSFVDRFRYKATKAKQAQSKLKAIEKLQKMDIDSPLGTVRINIPPVEDMKKGLLLRLNSVAVGYGDKAIASKINLQIDKGQHVAILGDNGQGKTTFLKTLVKELSPLTGTIKWAPDTEFSYYAQHIPEQMDKREKVGDYLRRMAPPAVFEEQILKMAANFLFSQDDLEKSISVLSGGEKARLCLAGLLLTKKNTLLLDEPTNHLDFETVEALGLALEEYEGNIFFISHNRTFVNSIATSILEVNNGEVRRYASSYEDYIYYLEKRIKEEQLDEAKEKETTADEAFAELKKIQYQEAKEEKNRLKKLEKAIKQLEEKRDILSAKQASDPVNFPPQDYELFGQIAAQLLDKEREWFELFERIEKMNRGEVE